MTTLSETIEKPASASQRLWQELLPPEARQELLEQSQDNLEIDVAIKIRVRRTRGRPSKYRPEYERVAYNLFANPSIVATTDFVSQTLGISRDTFYRWKTEQEGFKEAVETGKAQQEHCLTQRLLSPQSPKELQESMYALKQLHHWKD